MVCGDTVSSLTHGGPLGGVVAGVDVTLKDWAGLKEEESLLHVYLLCRGAFV